MTGTVKHQRSGVSLLEVLISIGVIAIGIFGVAALIPVAQLKVAEGTSRDRQAAFGPSAAAERCCAVNRVTTSDGPCSNSHVQARTATGTR